MTVPSIIKYRLINQQISNTKFKKPEELVKWFGGIQAQSYSSAKWAIGSRLPGITDIDVEQAITDKRITRTWLMRGTLHIVAAKDIRWMLTLLAPRIISKIIPRIRQFGIDKPEFKKSNKVLIKALRDCGQLTRDELAASLKKGGIDATGLRLAHILLWAALEQIICFGSKRGNQFTFTLFDKWIPKENTFEHEEALAEITRRYFTSRGPATLQDFIWWSGLTMTDAKTGLELAKQWLIKEKFGGNIYWLPENMPEFKSSGKGIVLLAGYDEYIISYRDRSSCLDAEYAGQVIQKNGIFNPVIIVNGIVKGTWKSVIQNSKASFQKNLFKEISKKHENAIISEAKKYTKFIGKTLKIN